MKTQQIFKENLLKASKKTTKVVFLQWIQVTGKWPPQILYNLPKLFSEWWFLTSPKGYQCSELVYTCVKFLIIIWLLQLFDFLRECVNRRIQCLYLLTEIFRLWKVELTHVDVWYFPACTHATLHLCTCQQTTEHKNHVIKMWDSA